MSNRELVRTLTLPQILMLGIGGTMGAGVFVLTGHAAGLVGPAVLLVFFLAALQSLPNALSYAELSSSFPVAGGGYAYISMATEGLIPFSVGWVSWFSGMFYSALAAVGAAYSLKIFVPSLNVPLTTTFLVLVFVIISIRGSKEAGQTQVILAGVLLFSLIVFVILGLVLPNGFTLAEFYKDSGFFIHEGFLKNMAQIFKTLTLVNVLFVGYEVIATTAEEAKNPGRNIPIAIIGSIILCAIVYMGITFTSLGIISAKTLGQSATPLSDAAAKLGPWGAPLMGAAGLIATLTSLNTAMISSARVALALSRDGYLPDRFSRIHPRLQTPVPSIILTGVIIAIAGSAGDEVFLGYVSNFGYMYVVFFTNVSLILLRRKRPDQERAFKTPWYPFLPVVGCLGIIVIEVFTEPHALIVGIGLIAIGVIVFQLRRPVERAVEITTKTVEAAQREILVPVSNPLTAESLIRMAAILGRAKEDATLAALSLEKVPSTTPLHLAQQRLENKEGQRSVLLSRIAHYGAQRNVPVRTMLRATRDIPSGILSVAESRSGLGLILMGWRGQLTSQRVLGSVVSHVVDNASCDVAVLRDRGLTASKLENVLVPVGNSPHAKLALRIAHDIVQVEGSSLTTLRVLPQKDELDLEVEMEVLKQFVEDELRDPSDQITYRLQRSQSLEKGLLEEARTGIREGEEKQAYDLIVIGASKEWLLKDLLFGSIPDRIANKAPCSVLLVKRFEPKSISWFRRVLKKLTGEK